MRKVRNLEPLTKIDIGEIVGMSNRLLGIEGLEPSRFLKSTDFPITKNFIVAGIDM
jgi:hypothetical protein